MRKLGAALAVSGQPVRAVLFAFLAALQGCVAQGLPEAPSDTPMAFHDTRLQLALLSNDESVLQRDFRLKSPPSPAVRGVSALLLPFTAATETVFLPFAASARVFSSLGSPEPGKTLD